MFCLYILISPFTALHAAVRMSQPSNDRAATKFVDDTLDALHARIYVCNILYHETIPIAYPKPHRYQQQQQQLLFLYFSYNNNNIIYIPMAPLYRQLPRILSIRFAFE